MKDIGADIVQPACHAILYSRTSMSTSPPFALAGYGAGDTPLNADAQIGKVSIGGDWIISNLVAGVMNVASFNQSFGDANDAKISGPGTTDTATVSKIARVVIKDVNLREIGAV
jgi:hypothetical protein